MTENSQEFLQKAQTYAAEAHRGQYRKSLDLPFIVHPTRVASILGHYGFDEETVAAGYLHDVPEDTDRTLEDIRREFGENVARYVEGASEDSKLTPGEEKDWETRKANTLEHLGEEPLKVVYLKAADKLDGVRCFQKEVLRYGEEFWTDLNGGGQIEEVRDSQAWFYNSFVDVIEDRIGPELDLDHPDYRRMEDMDHPLYRDLKENVNQLF